jgi:hypothetical protein
LIFVKVCYTFYIDDGAVNRSLGQQINCCKFNLGYGFPYSLTSLSKSTLKTCVSNLLSMSFSNIGDESLFFALLGD